MYCPKIALLPFYIFKINTNHCGLVPGRSDSKLHLSYTKSEMVTTNEPFYAGIVLNRFSATFEKTISFTVVFLAW